MPRARCPPKNHSRSKWENHAHTTETEATCVNPRFIPRLEPTAKPDNDHLRVQVTAVSLRKHYRLIITPDAMHLTGLFLYPVKSFRGCAVSAADVDALGLVGDRRFLVVDENGAHLTQRPLPRMALISTALDPTHLTLSADGAASVRIPRHSSLDPHPATTRTVSIWRSQGLLAEDCGRDVSAWLSAFLGVTCHLVRIGEKFRRPVLDHPAFSSAPANSPISEMPSWTVGKNRLGSSARRKAAPAPERPSATSCFSRDLREDTTAISLMAKTPLARNKRQTTRISIRTIVIRTAAAGPPEQEVSHELFSARPGRR